MFVSNFKCDQHDTYKARHYFAIELQYKNASYTACTIFPLLHPPQSLQLLTPTQSHTYVDDTYIQLRAAVFLLLPPLR